MKTLPIIPAFNRGLMFAAPTWDKFAGVAGAYVAESLCGQFEAMAEPVPCGWRCWLVPVDDPENALCMEEVCAC